jgi:hypothetical protein
MCYFIVAIAIGFFFYVGTEDWKFLSKWRVWASIAAGMWWPITIVGYLIVQFFRMFTTSSSYSKDVDVTIHLKGETYRGTVRKD